MTDRSATRIVEWVRHMKIVQVVLDTNHLLRLELRALELRASEERDRRGYLLQPQGEAESRGWESEAAWPGAPI
jgi:hypothetical protein